MKTSVETSNAIDAFLRRHHETLRNFARCYETERGLIRVWVNDDFTIRTTCFDEKPFDRRPFRALYWDKSVPELLEKFLERKLFFVEVLYDGICGGQHLKTAYIDACESF
jgi:hypothetical protein